MATMRLSPASTATLSLRRTSVHPKVHLIRLSQLHPTRYHRVCLPPQLKLCVIHHAQARSYSTPTPYRSPTLLKIKTIPAPHQGVIRILSLNRPEARNALSRQMVAELTEEVERVAEEQQQQQQQHEDNHHMNNKNNSARALIFTSNTDTCFCAGADLKERATFTHDQTRKFLSNLRTLYTSISALPIPTITAISSSAFGGGLELALSSTFRVFAADAILSLPETANLAIIPGAGGTYRLPSLIGLSRATEMILTGRRLKGVEAGAWGICERVVVADEDASGDVRHGHGPKHDSDADGSDGADGKVGHDQKKNKNKKTMSIREKVDQQAITLALELCRGAPLATTAALRAIRGWRDGGVSEARAYEGVVRTRDRDEALAAFSEKRRPVFEGR